MSRSFSLAAWSAPFPIASPSAEARDHVVCFFRHLKKINLASMDTLCALV